MLTIHPCRCGWASGVVVPTYHIYGLNLRNPRLRREIQILQKLLLSGLLQKRSAIISCDGAAVHVLYSPGRNAQMVRIHQNRYVIGTEYGAQMLGNLHREPLLDLRAFCKILHNPVDFGQTDDIAVGDIGNVGFPNNRHEMVFAVGIKSDVLFYQHFAIAVLVFKQGDIGFVFGVQTAEDFLNVHFCDPLRCAAQAVVGQVEAHGEHDFSEMMFDPCHFFLIRQLERIWSHGRFKGSHDVVVSKVFVCQVEDIFEIIRGDAHDAGWLSQLDLFRHYNYAQTILFNFLGILIKQE